MMPSRPVVLANLYLFTSGGTEIRKASRFRPENY
jgi:hypothetical protein